jgi:hypothetical protein
VEIMTVEQGAAGRIRGRSARAARVAGAIVLLAAVACGRPTDPSVETDPGDIGDLAGGLWTELPDPPLSERVDTGVVWAGDRLVAWGGATPGIGAAEPLLDGATWAPDAGWSPMAPAPVNGGLARGGFALWTGQDVVFGPVASEAGDPAASLLLAYAPVDERWRSIPADPDLAAVLGEPADGFRGVAAVVRDEIIVGAVGAAGTSGRLPGALVAVDPATGRTRPLDPGPFDASPYADLSGDVLVASAGDRLLAVPNWSAETWLLDPADGGSWTETSPPPVDGLHLGLPVWVDGEAFFPDDGVALDPSDDSWRPLAAAGDLATLRLDGGGTVPLSAGDQIMTTQGVYDTGGDGWYELPPLSLGPEQVLLDPFVGWTGERLVVFGGGTYECPPNSACDIDPGSVDWNQRGWVYEP